MRIFRDREQRTRFFLHSLFALMFVGVAMIGAGVFLLGNQVRFLARQQIEYRQKTDEAQKQILAFAQLSAERWEALQSYNPSIAVPRIVQPENAKDKTPKLIVPPQPKSSTPAPSPTAVDKKTRTIIRYRNRSTPKPWYHFFDFTR